MVPWAGSIPTNSLTSDPLRVLTTRGRGLAGFRLFNTHTRKYSRDTACTCRLLSQIPHVGPFTHMLHTLRQLVATKVGELRLKVVKLLKN